MAFKYSASGQLPETGWQGAAPLRARICIGRGRACGFSADRVDASGAASALGQIELLCKADAARGEVNGVSDSCPLNVYNAYATVAQIVSRDAVVGVSYDIAYLDGYQSNPYRNAAVPELGHAVPERHPFTRLRQSVAGSARYFVAKSKTTLSSRCRPFGRSRFAIALMMSSPRPACAAARRCAYHS